MFNFWLDPVSIMFYFFCAAYLTTVTRKLLCLLIQDLTNYIIKCKIYKVTSLKK